MRQRAAVTQTSALNPYQADVIECPYRMHERMREQGVYHLASADTYVVSRWDDLQFVLKHSELFSNLGGARSARSERGGGRSGAPDRRPSRQ